MIRLRTILKLVSWASDFFACQGIDSPRIDAEILLSHALTLRRIDLYLQPERTLSAVELDRFCRMVSRRGAREPVAYITEEREFWSLSLQVTPKVLIPSPETECLVEGALSALKRLNTPGPKHILDLGTGSGAIILAVASECPQDVCFATDRSPEALCGCSGKCPPSFLRNPGHLSGRGLVFAGCKPRPLMSFCQTRPTSGGVISPGFSPK